MVDLSGGPEGPIEHGFSNGVFVIPAVIIISLSDSHWRDGDSREPIRMMLRVLALLSMGGLLARATPEAEDDEALVEDEEARPAAGGFPGFPDGKLPTAEELLKMLDTMSGLSDEDREAIRADLLKKGAGGAGAEGAHQVAAGAAFPEFLVLMGMLAFVALIFVKMELLDKFSSKFDLSDELRDKLAGMVMRYKSLDATGKAEFLGLAKDSLVEQLGRLVAKKQITHNFTWLVVAVAIVVLLFVFFGYKLYKSLSERERKREEKKKNKQMKKKK